MKRPAPHYKVEAQNPPFIRASQLGQAKAVALSKQAMGETACPKTDNAQGFRDTKEHENLKPALKPRKVLIDILR